MLKKKKFIPQLKKELLYFHNMKSFLLLINLVLISTVIYSQTERETRAVWITTNFRLDWPPPNYDPGIQRNALTEILNDIKHKNFNTVFFQVRSSGTTLFNSSYEPYSYYLTGHPGESPSYDPLEFAVEEAHKKGLELHVWINTFRCYAGSDDIILESPNHIVNRHPEWIKEVLESGKLTYWLNPGLPEVRKYLINVILEIAENYNIDGIHLDYIRYPGSDFDDSDAYRLYGSGMSLDDWRRNNINEFVKELSLKVRKIKPYIKLGAAPFGIYKNIAGAVGSEGYSDVYQDSREWLRNGYVDYLVPQIYWDMETNPRFDVLADDWVNNSYGRNVVLGIGAYKGEVYKELDKLIDYSRKISSSGVSFFRYSFIKQYDFYSFHDKAFPAAMPWIDGFNPRPPVNLAASVTGGVPVKINLSWQRPLFSVNGDSAVYFAIYNFDSPFPQFTSENLLDVISSSKNRVSLAIDRPKQVNYYFALKSLDKLWNESEHYSNIVEAKITSLENIAEKIKCPEQPLLVKDKRGSIHIIVFSDDFQNIDILMESSGEFKFSESLSLEKGVNIIALKDDKIEEKLIKFKYKLSGKEFILNQYNL